MSTLAAALDYAARGWRVIPIPNGLKHPNRPGWQDAATTDADLITQWWGEHPDHGIGIATGAASGIWVLDVDVGPGKDGADTLADLEATYGPLPDTVEAITGTGGRHIYFAWPDDGRDIRNDQAGRLGPGLDIRGTGGQVLAPPTIHPNGQPYEWELSSPAEPAQAPGWLLELLTAPSLERPRLERKPPAVRPDGATLPGDRFEAETSWRALLEQTGATHIDTRTHHETGQPYELWSRPPMPPAEPGFRPHTSATLNYAGGDVLKVFTSNWIVADPTLGTVARLEPDATYTRFGYWAAVYHGGDHSAAASALAAHYADAAIADWTASDGAPPPAIAPAEEPAAPAIGIRWVDDLATDMPPEPPVIVEGILRAGELAAIAAPRAIGKTWLSFNLATLLAEGDGLFLGSLEVRRPARVLYLQGELDEWGSAVRWKMLTGIERPLPHIAETFDRLRLRTVRRQTKYTQAGVIYSDEHIDATLPDSLETAIKDHAIDLVIVDPWAVYFAGNENSNDEAEAVLGALRAVTLRTGVAWLIVHHITGKAERSAWTEPEDLWRGATRLGDWASTRITVLPHYTETARKEAGMDRHEARRHVDVHILRRNGEPVPTLHARRRPDGWWERWEPGEAVEVAGTSLRRLVQVLDLEGGEVGSLRALAKLVGLSPHATDELVAKGVAAGLVETIDGARGAKIVRLVEGTPSPWTPTVDVERNVIPHAGHVERNVISFPTNDRAMAPRGREQSDPSRGRQLADLQEHIDRAPPRDAIARSENRESAGQRPRATAPSPTGRGDRADDPPPEGSGPDTPGPGHTTNDPIHRAHIIADLIGAGAPDPTEEPEDPPCASTT